jgi:hypothetical protein
MADAIELGLSPKRIQSKMRTLRAYKAKKFGVTIAQMEVIFGWDIDEMAGSLVYAIKHERCRGPRCGRVKFTDMVTADYLLELITCDVLDPETPPLWCMNIRWVCSRDNKGDRDLPMRERAARLVVERTTNMDLVKMEPINMEQGKLFE